MKSSLELISPSVRCFFWRAAVPGSAWYLEAMGVKGLPLLFRVPQRSRKNSEDPSCSSAAGSGQYNVRHGSVTPSAGSVSSPSGTARPEESAWKMLPNSALRSFSSAGRFSKAVAPGPTCGEKEFITYILRRLAQGDPQEPENTIAFNYRSGDWVLLTRRRFSCPIDLFEETSRLIHKDSAEGIALINKMQALNGGHLGFCGRMETSRRKIATAKRNVMTATKAAVQLGKDNLKKEASIDRNGSVDSDSDSGTYLGLDATKPSKARPGAFSMSANKFNYYERGTQTGHACQKEKDTMTDPPTLKEMKGVFCQWVAHDHYEKYGYVRKGPSYLSSVPDQTSATDGEDQPTMSRSNSCADALAQVQPDEEPVPGNKTPSRPGTPVQATGKQNGNEGCNPELMAPSRPYDYCKQPLDLQATERALLALFTQQKSSHIYQDLVVKRPVHNLRPLSRSARIIERMINQNVDDSVLIDFKYWEDAADEFREHEGTLLPLWTFTTTSNSSKKERLSVTGVAWSKVYPDLFAVSFGSYDFNLQPRRGLLCIFTLKNTETPEYEFETSSGVMCVAAHPRYPHLVAIGCYDGTIEVYNLKINNRKGSMVWQSVANEDGHTDVVWSVAWISDDQDGRPLLLSLSADGHLVQWTVHLASTEIKRHNIVHLKIEPPVVLSDKSLYYTHACGTSMAFHPNNNFEFLVGTEEGHIYFGSTSYHSKILKKFSGHNMAVYGLAWNHYSDHIFLSCGADWTVRMWDSRKQIPLLEIDVGCEVEDVAWAPYSSTVLAAVTGEGEVQVFDLAEDRFAPICVQKVTRKRKSRCTRIAFNPVHPIILVGDSRGNVESLKLSPNLRKKPKQSKNMTSDEKMAELEEKKLAALLALL